MAERLTKTELMQQVKECIEKWLVGHAHVLYDMQRLVDGWVAIKEQQNMDEMKVLKFFQDIDSMHHMNFYEVTFVYMKAKLRDSSEEYFQGHYFPETNELRYHFNRSCDIRIKILREAIEVQEKIVSKWQAFDMRNDHILKAYANAFASGTLHGVKDFETSFIGSLPPAPHKLEIDYEDNDPYTSYVPDVGSVLEQVKTTRFNPEEFNLDSSGKRMSTGIFNGFLKKILIRNNALKNALVYPEGLDYWNRKIDEYNENLIFAINEFHSPVLLFCVRSALNITPPAPKGWKGIFCLLDESKPYQSKLFPFPIVSVSVATPKSKSSESMASVTPGENVRVPIVQQDQETTSGPRRDEESFETDHSQEDLQVQQATPVSMSSQDVNVHVPNIVRSTEKEEKSFEEECPHEVPNAEQHQETTPVSTRSDGIYFVVPNIEEKTEKVSQPNPDPIHSREETQQEACDKQNIGAVKNDQEGKELPDNSTEETNEEISQSNEASVQGLSSNTRLERNRRRREAKKERRRKRVEKEKSDDVTMNDEIEKNKEDLVEDNGFEDYESRFDEYLEKVSQVTFSDARAKAQEFIDRRLRKFGKIRHHEVALEFYKTVDIRSLDVEMIHMLGFLSEEQGKKSFIEVEEEMVNLMIEEREAEQLYFGTELNGQRNSEGQVEESTSGPNHCDEVQDFTEHVIVDGTIEKVLSDSLILTESEQKWINDDKIAQTQVTNEIHHVAGYDDAITDETREQLVIALEEMDIDEDVKPNSQHLTNDTRENKQQSGNDTQSMPDESGSLRAFDVAPEPSEKSLADAIKRKEKNKRRREAKKEKKRQLRAREGCCSAETHEWEIEETENDSDEDNASNEYDLKFDEYLVNNFDVSLEEAQAKAKEFVERRLRKFKKMPGDASALKFYTNVKIEQLDVEMVFMLGFLSDEQGKTSFIEVEKELVKVMAEEATEVEGHVQQADIQSSSPMPDDHLAQEPSEVSSAQNENKPEQKK